jgi:hypothetical protein
VPHHPADLAERCPTADYKRAVPSDTWLTSRTIRPPWAIGRDSLAAAARDASTNACAVAYASNG